MERKDGDEAKSVTVYKKVAYLFFNCPKPETERKREKNNVYLSEEDDTECKFHSQTHLTTHIFNILNVDVH